MLAGSAAVASGDVLGTEEGTSIFLPDLRVTVTVPVFFLGSSASVSVALPRALLPVGIAACTVLESDGPGDLARDLGPAASLPAASCLGGTEGGGEDVTSGVLFAFGFWTDLSAVLLLELSPLETPRLSAFALFVAGVRGLSIPASS